MKKRTLKMYAAATAVFALGIFSASAQEPMLASNTAPTEAKCDSEIDFSLDIYSSYVWRGVKFGTGAAFQPSLEYTCGNFTMGAWGNANTGSDEAPQTDLYMEYAFPFDVTIGVTDYYTAGNYLGTSFKDIATTHSIEPSLRYDYGDLSFFGALMFMDEGASDFYGELSYKFEKFDFAIGAGDGAYTSNPAWQPTWNSPKEGEFGICNLTISKEKEVKITDSFSIPMKGAITLNPSSERCYAYIGITF